MRRAIDAIGAGAQIDAVQIKLENFLLAQRFFERRRIHQFFELARERPVGIEEDDLGRLLRDGRTASHHMARMKIGDGRPHEPADIDAVVAVEAPVLHRDEGGRQIGGHLIESQPLAHDRAAMTHVLAARVEKGEGDGPVDGVKVLAQIELGREQFQDRGRQIEQRHGNRDDRDRDGEDANEADAVADGPIAQRLQVFQQIITQHGRLTHRSLRQIQDFTIRMRE